MVNTSRKLLLTTSVALSMFAVQPALALFGGGGGGVVYCTNCSDKWTQATQVAKDIETAVNTAQQLQTQIQQYNDMI